MAHPRSPGSTERPDDQELNSGKPPGGTENASSGAATRRDKAVLFGFSVVLLFGIAAVTLVNPFFTSQQWFTYTCILALAAGGFAASLPGAVQWEVASQLRATGAIAIVLIVLFAGSKVEGKQVQSRRWSLVWPSNADAPNPEDAVVYVGLNDQLIKAAGPGPTIKVDPKLGSDVAVQRGIGGIVVEAARTSPGQRLFMLVEDQSREGESKWWISREVTIPPTELLEVRATTLTQIKKRVPVR